MEKEHEYIPHTSESVVSRSRNSINRLGRRRANMLEPVLIFSKSRKVIGTLGFSAVFLTIIVSRLVGGRGFDGAMFGEGDDLDPE